MISDILQLCDVLCSGIFQPFLRKIKQEGQYTINIVLRRDFVIIVAVQKEDVLHILSVCL